MLTSHQDGRVISSDRQSANHVQSQEGPHEQATLYQQSFDCALYHTGPERPLQILSHLLRDPLVKHYMDHVLNDQYHLANKTATAALICVSVQTDTTVHAAVQLLAAVHQDKHRSGEPRALEASGRDSYTLYRKLSKGMLDEGQVEYTQENAMAALLVISSVLFDGGMGNWLPWLLIAYAYLDRAFKLLGGAERALQTRAKDERFIFVVKTTFWFDVIASVTRQQKPHYYHEIDTLFHPSHLTASTPLLSMEDSIGCHNDIFWALNRTSAFSSGANPLSRPSEDTDYTMNILDKHAQRHRESAASHDGWSSHQYTSYMLCMATIVWLRSLMPGASSSRRIKHTVKEFLQSLRDVPREEGTKRHIVRSSVFSIFICGLFVTRREDRRLLEDHLYQQSTDSIGNCTAIVTLLKSIWQDHDSASDQGKWFLPSVITKSLRYLIRYLRCKMGLVPHMEQDPSPLNRGWHLLKDSCLLLV
ncbi:hypothetical protein EYR40_008067 [Pleurotus pulmonarius]|nr:hypothetical protein EYR40_008067 [Pleurotus pulmonarius]